MTNRCDDEQDGLCPDNQHDDFEKGVRQIIDLASGLSGTLKTLPTPSKIKRELVHLRDVLRKLSPDAHSTLWEWGTEGFQYSPTSDLLARIDAAMVRVGSGRPKHDVARRFLGERAAALWLAHCGNITDENFVLFLEYLIEEAGFDVGRKVRVHAVTLAEELKEITRR